LEMYQFKYLFYHLLQTGVAVYNSSCRRICN